MSRFCNKPSVSALWRHGAKRNLQLSQKGWQILLASIWLYYLVKEKMFSHLLLRQLCSLTHQTEDEWHKTPRDPFLSTLIPLQVAGTLIRWDVTIWNPFHWNLLEDKAKVPITFQSTSTSKIPNILIKPQSTTPKFLLRLTWCPPFLGLYSHRWAMERRAQAARDVATSCPSQHLERQALFPYTKPEAAHMVVVSKINIIVHCVWHHHIKVMLRWIILLYVCMKAGVL